MEKIGMTYYYNLNHYENVLKLSNQVSGVWTVIPCNVSCDVYKFSNPDCCEAMALCYFPPETSSLLSTLSNDISTITYIVPYILGPNKTVSSNIELSTLTVILYPMPEHGFWKSIHVRNLKPN